MIGDVNRNAYKSILTLQHYHGLRAFHFNPHIEELAVEYVFLAEGFGVELAGISESISLESLEFREKHAFGTV